MSETGTFISLENFDPKKKKGRILTSPKSLEACKR